jgi:hypothetical protein
MLKGSRKAFGKFQRLLDSLWAIMKGYRKAIGKCPNNLYMLGNCSSWLGVTKNRRQGRIAHKLIGKNKNFL